MNVVTSGCLVAMPKSDSGIRPLTPSMVSRRSVPHAAARVFQPHVHSTNTRTPTSNGAPSWRAFNNTPSLTPWILNWLSTRVDLDMHVSKWWTVANRWRTRGTPLLTITFMRAHFKLQNRKMWRPSLLDSDDIDLVTTSGACIPPYSSATATDSPVVLRHVLVPALQDHGAATSPIRPDSPACEGFAKQILGIVSVST